MSRLGFIEARTLTSLNGMKPQFRNSIRSSCGQNRDSVGTASIKENIVLEKNRDIFIARNSRIPGLEFWGQYTYVPQRPLRFCHAFFLSKSRATQNRG